MIVLNQRGPAAASAVQAVSPQVEVIDVPADGPVDAAVRGDALLATERTTNVFELAERVDWVHLPSAGVDWFPAHLLTGRTVTCSRGTTSVPIAEFVLASMLAYEKHLPDVWLSAKPARWASGHDLGTLVGRHVGIVGLGTIGQAVASRCLAFDSHVRALRRSVGRPSPIADVGLAESLGELLEWSDHLVLAVPATPSTSRMFGATEFARCRRQPHLINVARGSLIDQDALRVALDQGVVSLATLDVCEPEPLPDGHWLYSHPKVHLSAHVAWVSPGSGDKVTDLFVANLRRKLAGEPLDDVVDPTAGY